jgi:hypothetical protein
MNKVLPAESNVELMRLPLPDIANYPVAVGHFDHGVFSVLPPETLRFTILRDPVERYLSTVSHMMRDAEFSHLHKKVRDLTFDEALIHPDVMSEMRNSMVKLFCHESISVGIESEAEAVAAQELRSSEVHANVELAKAHLETYDVVGVQEQYFDSVQLMLLAAGLPPTKVAPVLNDDRSDRRESVSPAVVQQVREVLDLDLQLYQYAVDRLRRSLSTTIYEIAIRQYAAEQPRLPERYKFELSELPGSYGWYQPELDPEGTRLWGGSRDEQGFVLRVEPATKYAIVARITKRDPDKELSVECSITGAVATPTPWGIILSFETGSADYMADVSFVYRGATSPFEEGIGTDRRKLGLVLFELGVFRVESFEDLDPGKLFEALHASGPGVITG